MIFAGDFRYELHHNALGPNHLRLVDSLADETVWSSGGVLSVAAAEVAAGGLETLASVYLFTSEKPRGFLSWSWPSSDRLQRLAAVTTDYSEYLFSLTGGDKQGKLVSRHTPPLHPTYSLILEVGAAQESSSVSSGYVIHKGEKNEYFSVLLQYFFSNFIFSTDIFDNTAGLILYDFNLPTPFHLHSSQLPVFNLNGTSPAADQTSSTTFFYIEKTEDPGKVRLVPRQKGAGNFSTSFKSDRQLFSGGGSSPPPIGCKLGDRLYLLDVHLGCVYILSGQLSQLGSFSKNGGGGKTPPGFILLNRTNVPFESFFLCDPLFFPKSKEVLKLDHNRCAKNVYVSEAEKAKIELQRKQLYQKIGIAFAAALGVVFLISVLITCYCCCCSKSGPSNNNSKNELKNEQGKLLKGSAPTMKKKKGSKTPATSATKTPTSNSSSKSSAATTTTGAKQNSGKTPSHSTTTSTSTTTPKQQSAPGITPILPPLGTPATAPPEGRAPFQERVKATAQAIAVRAPPPPPPPKVASKVEAAADKGGGVPVSKTAKVIVDNVSSGKSLGE